MSEKPDLLLGQTLGFAGDPFDLPATEAARHNRRGGVLLRGGVIEAVGDGDALKKAHPDAIVHDYRDGLITAGFVDAHVHYPQTGMIASWGKQLIDWLNTYTFPEEMRFADPAVAAEVAATYFDLALANGTTSMCSYCTIHPESVDAFFSEALRRQMRVAGGKTCMDRNAPDGLRDTARSAYDDSKALIGKWHGRGRLTYAVTQAYHTLMPQGRYPLTVIMITLPPDEVDVNVHPTKTEVRFRVPDAIFSAVQRAVRRAVVDQAPVPGMQGEPYSNSRRADRPAWGRGPGHDVPAPDRTSERAFDRPHAPEDQQLRLDLESSDPGAYAYQRAPNEFGAPALPGKVEDLPEQDGYSHGQSYVTDQGFGDDSEIPAGPGAPKRPRTLPIMRVIGQVGAMYIVAEGPAGVYLVDQHAAHERILYEQFMAQQAAMKPVAQQTLPVTTLEFSPGVAQLVEESLATLHELGFDLELFGTNTFRVRAIPALLADREPEQVLRAMVEDLESGATPGEVTLEEKLVRRVCKTAAVKAGQVLSYEEMQGLIQQLERCEFPRTCPHGRPTMLHISGDELAKQFGRT